MSNIICGKFFYSSKNTSSTLDFYSNLRPNITFKKNGGYRINSITVPSFYNINSNTNTLVIRNTANVEFNVSVPVGYYTAEDLKSALKTALDNSGAGLTFTITSNPTNLNSGSSGTYKITISATGNFSILTTDASTLAPLIGFSSFKSGGSSYTGDDMVNVSGYNSIYLCSKTLSGFNTDQNVFTFGSSDIICAVPITSSFGMNTYYESFHKEFIPIGNNTDIILNRVDFFFRDEAGNIIDFDSASSNYLVEVAFF